MGVILWLDRWERERPRRLVSAFAWGASIAAFCAIWSQAGLQALVDTTMGTDVGAWVRPLIITPVTEEVFKGLFLVWLLIYRRRRITGLLDGIVYAGLVGPASRSRRTSSTSAAPSPPSPHRTPPM